MMRKWKWFILLIVVGVAFLTLKVIGDDKKPSLVDHSVESSDDIIPYFKSITPGLELAMRSGDYQIIKSTALPDKFKINVDGVWYSRYNLSVFYHVDLSESEYVVTRDRKDLPQIDRLVVEQSSGELSVLELVQTEEGVLFEGDYYMKGTFQPVINPETKQPIKEVVGSIINIVSADHSIPVDMPFSYQYEREEKKVVQIDESKKFEEVKVTALEWEVTPSDSRLLLEIEAPFSGVVQMDLAIVTPKGRVLPQLFERLAKETYSVSFPAGTELPTVICFYGLTAASSKEIMIDVDPNQYEIYKRIKEATYEDQLDEPIMMVYGSEVVKDSLFYNEHGVTFHLLAKKVASQGPYVNFKAKEQMLIEVINDKKKERRLRARGEEQDRVSFMVDRGFYERSEQIQVKMTNLPVYVKTNWSLTLSNE